MGLGTVLRALDEHGWVARMLELKPLAGLGLISYGFYVFHMIPINAWRYLAELHPGLTNYIPLLAFPATLLVALVSYRFLETPFLRLKKVLAPQRAGPVPQAAPEAPIVSNALPPGFHVSEPHT